MKGKERCKILKEIRQKIADANDIAYITSECKHKGDCLGTCPKCESEVAYLERELNRRRALGKAVSIAGLAVVTAVSGGCRLPNGEQPLAGEPLPNTEVTDSVIDGEIAVPGEIFEGTETEETPTAGVPPVLETESAVGELPVSYELMGDYAFMPPPDFNELASLCQSEADFEQQLFLCHRSDIVSAWCDYRVETTAGTDSFLLPDGKGVITLHYGQDGFVTRVSVKDVG
ncbi:MAG: hypothetical protein IJD10_03495 [Clostridia bacterium]|nr:hypothetical protein [Clostridia bacterium]